MRVLLTGAAGFVGSAVAEELATRKQITVRAAFHSRVPAVTRIEGERRAIDLGDPESLRGLAEGVDVLLHVAHLIGGPKARMAAVNADGTRALVDLCDQAGVGRMVRLSTASVYGPGPWRGENIHDLEPSPGSATSSTRLLGDSYIHSAGGVVVRPHLVHGPGDRWFVPRARTILSRIGWLGDGTRHSTIHVRALARLMVDLALGPAPASGVVLAADPPRSLREVIHGADFDASVPPGSVTLDAALDHPAGRDDPRWEHDIRLLGQDHYLTDMRR